MRLKNIVLLFVKPYKQNGSGGSKIGIIQHLFIYYHNLKKQKEHLPKFQETGFRVYSQSDEDGLLLYIFSLIGFTNKICVDIAFGSPYGANVTNLICNWGFTGLLVESKDIDSSIKFFLNHPDTCIYPPKIIKKWITQKNVNSILRENNISGDIDLLSLDLDGVDYWIWKAINTITPRVVVVEYMNIFDKDKSVSVPYKEDFNRFDTHPDFCGASLKAFVKLGKSKNYRLIGCNKYGFNAFFLRKDIAGRLLPEISINDCLKHPQAREGQQKRLPAVKDLDWVEV